MDPGMAMAEDTDPAMDLFTDLGLALQPDRRRWYDYPTPFQPL